MRNIGSDRDCGCAIGASLPRDLINEIVEADANGRFVDVLTAQFAGLVAFEDMYFANDLQAAHDEWCNAVRSGDGDEDGHKAAFLRLIEHPSAVAA